MKHSCPDMQKRLEGLCDAHLQEHVSYFKDEETGRVAKHLMDKRNKKDSFKKLDKNGDGVITRDEFDK